MRPRNFLLFLGRVVFLLLASIHPLNCKHNFITILHFSRIGFQFSHIWFWVEGNKDDKFGWINVNVADTALGGNKATSDNNWIGIEDCRERCCGEGYTNSWARRPPLLVQSPQPHALSDQLRSLSGISQLYPLYLPFFDPMVAHIILWYILTISMLFVSCFLNHRMHFSWLSLHGARWAKQSTQTSLFFPLLLFAASHGFCFSFLIFQYGLKSCYHDTTEDYVIRITMGWVSSERYNLHILRSNFWFCVLLICSGSWHRYCAVMWHSHSMP